jgi:hypothetical protein
MFFVRWLAAPRNTSGAELCEYSSRKWCSTSQPVGEFDLVEAVLEQLELAVLGPRTRQLVLVEDPEFHATFVADGQYLMSSA